ncbi:MAG: hypothetical protein GWO20_19210 [Candidatus Korarchaeota archaeon]|nr:hypothetical protein [Candidatus Korarchaeota archaeon]NIU85386.1 hypothetical protein [Candidatus Thorarchaeota archaeon]NIW15484.1 hypothetical protein [Candidatus Thorarchaeota archaeon]NIW53428.1 hypothetical protein [Candidatus Korarchaeota archaeon]
MDEKNKLNPLQRHLPMSLHQTAADVNQLLDEVKQQKERSEGDVLELFEAAMSQYIIEKFRKDVEMSEGFKNYLEERYEIKVDEFPENLKGKLEEDILLIVAETLGYNIQTVDIDALAETAHEEMGKTDKGLHSFKEEYDAKAESIF